MTQNIKEILNGNFNFSDEDIVIGNILDLFQYSNTIIKYLEESTNHISGYKSYKDKVIKNYKTLKSSLDEKDNLAKAYREFLNSEKELKSKKEEVDTLKKRIAEIEALNLKYANIDIDKLKKEHTRLLTQNQEKYQKIIQIEEDNRELKQLINNLDKNMVELNNTNSNDIKRVKEIFNNIRNYIDRNWDDLDDRLSKESRRLKTSTKQYANLLEEIDNRLIEIGRTKQDLENKNKELSGLFEKHTKLNNIYKTEFEQNSKYVEMNSSKLDDLSQDIKNGLNEFNLILQEIIDKNEKIKNEIRELNR